MWNSVNIFTQTKSMDWCNRSKKTFHPTFAASFYFITILLYCTAFAMCSDMINVCLCMKTHGFCECIRLSRKREKRIYSFEWINIELRLRRVMALIVILLKVYKYISFIIGFVRHCNFSSDSVKHKSDSTVSYEPANVPWSQINCVGQLKSGENYC